jgi:RimJ/RimL family protein N-acetyltransferase
VRIVSIVLDTTHRKPSSAEARAIRSTRDMDTEGPTVREPSFVGRTIVLVPVSREHYGLLHRWSSDPRSAYLWTNSRRLRSCEQFGYEIDQLLVNNLLLLIAGKRTGELYGFVQTYGSSPYDGHTSVLVYLEERRRRLGVGAEALCILMDYLFTYFPYRKVYAEVYEFNHESRRALENGGFVEEGCFREHVWHDGRHWNLYKYAFYREWAPRLRQRLKGLVSSRGATADGGCPQ